jgi:hypothetical protein
MKRAIAFDYVNKSAFYVTLGDLLQCPRHLLLRGPPGNLLRCPLQNVKSAPLRLAKLLQTRTWVASTTKTTLAPTACLFHRLFVLLGIVLGI